MTASTFFTPGPNGEPPMFGKGGFAESMTPKDEKGWTLRYLVEHEKYNNSWAYTDFDYYLIHGRETDLSALDRCIVAAIGAVLDKRKGK